MADPITTLLVLYFITPATSDSNVNTSEEKRILEAKKIWTLQSTSQIPTENPSMCVSIGTKLIQQFTNVSTMTVRAYCLCPEKTEDNDVCFNQRETEKKGLAAQPHVGTIVTLGPNGAMKK